MRTNGAKLVPDEAESEFSTKLLPVGFSRHTNSCREVHRLINLQCRRGDNLSNENLAVGFRYFVGGCICAIVSHFAQIMIDNKK